MSLLAPLLGREPVSRANRKLARTTQPSGHERFFEDDEVIVSKTDPTGRITYVNRVFLRISGFEERELLGAPHSVIRHPDMPRCVFKLLWDTITAGQEIFAYVINMSKNGDHYWVLAHVTPSVTASGEIIGFHSNRRTPDRKVLDEAIIPLYGQLLAEEQRHDDRKKGLQSAYGMVTKLLEEKGVGYDEFVLSL